ncbi:hypothetical protein EDD15DRAFT_2567286 [Pisolithus albus]|nr:hypothetical protein EDD15DRAFT_2567286 [Pisolithus albus]
MFAFAVDHPPPATVILVSGDRDYAYALSTLRLRNYKVVLITPYATSSLEACLDQYTDGNDDSSGFVTASEMPASPHRSSISQPTPMRRRSASIRSGTVSKPRSESSRLVTQRLSHPPDTCLKVSGNADATTGGSDPFVPNGGGGHQSSKDEPQPSIRTGSSAVKAQPPQTTFNHSGLNLSNPGLAVSSTISSLSGVGSVSAAQTPTPPASSMPTITTEQSNREQTRRQFLPLIRQLVADRRRGVLRSSRSDVAAAVMQADENAYERVGVTKFKRYVALAQRAGLVVLGGAEGDAWIALHPDWLDEAEATEFHFETWTGDSPAVDENWTSTSRQIGAGCFQPLVDILVQFHRSGVRSVLRSRVGQMLEPTAYRDAGVSGFKEYIRRAIEVGIVLCGGVDGHAWICLHPDLEV